MVMWVVKVAICLPPNATLYPVLMKFPEASAFGTLMMSPIQNLSNNTLYKINSLQSESHYGVIENFVAGHIYVEHG